MSEISQRNKQEMFEMVIIPGEKDDTMYDDGNGADQTLGAAVISNTPNLDLPARTTPSITINNSNLDINANNSNNSNNDTQEKNNGSSHCLHSKLRIISVVTFICLLVVAIVITVVVVQTSKSTSSKQDINPEELTFLLCQVQRYPYWPSEFVWSYEGNVSGFSCLPFVEPTEPAKHSWDDNYLCARSGKDLLSSGMKWSFEGPITGMRCTNVKEPADPWLWQDNYICVPNNSPYHFSYSIAGAINGAQCIQLLEPSDPHPWSDNFLCSNEYEAMRYPDWPFDFKWSHEGLLNRHTCLQIIEPNERSIHTWEDNYLCAKSGSRLLDPKFKWSSQGKISGLKCVQLLEPNDPHTWSDNYLCHEQTGYPRWPADFAWSSVGPIDGYHKCVQIKEPFDPHTWMDNYLCWKQGPKMKDPQIKWSHAGKRTNMRCIQIRETKDPDSWDDNYLCVAKYSPYHFVWSSGGVQPIGVSGLSCIQWAESADNHTWSDNYLCHQPT